MRLVRPLSSRHAVILTATLAAAIFLFDVSQPLGVAGGIPYIGLPLLGLLARSPRMIVALGAGSTVLILAGMAVSKSGTTLNVVLMNRGMCLALVWTVTLIALRHLAIGERLRESLRKQVAEDPLTGLYNRRYVFDIVERELTRYRRYREPLALILIDADHFKRVNDTWGHCAGDKVLQHIADVCRNSVRESDVVGRFGGEEFIIVLPHTRASDAGFVAHRIRQSMQRAGVRTDAGEIKVTLSLGIAECGPGTDTFDRLLQAADQALYAAKQAGRNRIAFSVQTGEVVRPGEPRAA